MKQYNFFINLPLAVAGFGTALFIPPNTSVLMGAVPRGRQGIASGIPGAGWFQVATS